jgi:hypothetical protein
MVRQGINDADRGGDTVPPRPDAVPGEVQRYEILHYVFPAGHAVGAR